MPGRLTLYVLSELVRAAFAVTVVLLVVLLSSFLIDLMADAAKGDIPVGAILYLVGYKVVANLGLIFPASFFLGALLALGRLHRDSEITAMGGCGISPLHLYRGIFSAALPLTIIVAMITLIWGPAAERAAARVLVEAQQQSRFGLMVPGRFHELDGDSVVYIEHRKRDGAMAGVFGERRVDGRLQIWIAEEGRRVANAFGGGEFLVLNEGRRYEGALGQARWQTMDYAEYGVRIAAPAAVEPPIRRYSKSMGQLLGERDQLGSLAELQRRISAPMMILILSIAALPLAQVSPRSGRHSSLISGFLLFLIYFNLVQAVVGLVATQAVPFWGAPFLVHAFALLLTSWAVRSRMHVRLRDLLR